MTSIRRQEDRTPAPGVPAFRITVELPAAWQSYIANHATDVFDDMEPDDPWNRAAADREAAKLEKEGYALLGPVIRQRYSALFTTAQALMAALVKAHSDRPPGRAAELLRQAEAAHC